MLAKVNTVNDFYHKENVEMMFLQLMADTNGEKMIDMEDKMKQVFGKDLLSKETKGIKNAVDLHTTKIQ